MPLMSIGKRTSPTALEVIADSKLWDISALVFFLLRIGRYSDLLTKQGCSLVIASPDLRLTIGSVVRADTPVLQFRTSRGLVSSLWKPRLLSLARAYFDDDLILGGSSHVLVEALYFLNIRFDRKATAYERLTRYVFHTRKYLSRSFAMSFESDPHYSLDASAYELFLDKHLQYTCAVFENEDIDLDSAQERKFKLISSLFSDHVGSLEGKKHLDIGCGWGGLIDYFQSFLGTESLGITNCQAQSEYIKMNSGAKVFFGDYSELSLQHNAASFDIVTIVGMSEHVVGVEKERLIQVAYDMLKPGGLLYFQSIAKPDCWIGGDAYRIAQEFVFPGHDLDTEEQMGERFRNVGFREVYRANHSGDYARTTMEWFQRISVNSGKFEELVGTRNRRIFEMYLLFASKLFGSGRGKLLRFALKKDAQVLARS